MKDMLLHSLAAGLVPLVIGFIWYNPKTLGAIWQKLVGLTEEDLKSSNMVRTYSLTYIFSVMFAMGMHLLTIHQNGVDSLLMHLRESLPEADKSKATVEILFNGNKVEDWQNLYRSFGHGFFHGILSSIFLFFPLLAINSMFELRKFKLILMNGIYWTLCAGIIGGIVCAWK